MIEKMELGTYQLTTAKERQDLLGTLMKLTALIIVVTSIPDFYFLIWESIVVILLTIGCIATFYFLNRRGHVAFSGNALVFLLSSILFLQSCQLGFDSLVFLFYIPLIIGIPFVVDNRNKYIYYLHIFHPIMYIAILFATDFSLLKINEYTSDQVAFVGEFNIIGVLLFCHYMLYIIIQWTKRSEHKYQLLVEDLNKQNAELQKINNELDRFVYSVSHDLRAPLASSLGLVELSKEEKEVDKLLYYNQLKGKSLKRLDDYVTSLIDFSRNYRLDLSEQEIDFKELVSQCLDLNKPYGDEADRVNTNVEINQHGLFVGDSVRIRIVINNLISNAFKYYDEQKLIPSLCIQINSDEKHVLIKFIDNGIGIDEAFQYHVFDMFYRASEKPKGSGLGLYITKEIVHKLKGTITLESKLGEGSTFIIDLPNSYKG